MGISPFELNSQQVISNCIGLKGVKREETLQYHSRWIIIIILTTIHESFYPRFQLRCLSDGLNLVLFVKNRYNDCSIAMTLVSWQIFAALYFLPRVMDDGKTSEPPPQVIASRKDQVGANLINLTRLNFSPLKLLHYFYVIPRSPVNTRDHRYFQLGPNNVVHQRRYTILLIPSNEFHRANLRFHSPFHSNSQSLQDIVALIPDKYISIVPNVVDRKTLMPRNKQTIEKFSSSRGQSWTTKHDENPKISDRRRDSRPNFLFEFFFFFLKKLLGAGRVSPIDFEAFPVSWPAGHTLGKVKGDGAKNLRTEASPFTLVGNRAGFFNTPEQRRFRCSKAVAGALTSRGSSRKESFKRTALKRTSPPLLPLLLSFFSALEN